MTIRILETIIGRGLPCKRVDRFPNRLTAAVRDNRSQREKAAQWRKNKAIAKHQTRLRWLSSIRERAARGFNRLKNTKRLDQKFKASDFRSSLWSCGCWATKCVINRVSLRCKHVLTITFTKKFGQSARVVYTCLSSHFQTCLTMHLSSLTHPTPSKKMSKSLRSRRKRRVNTCSASPADDRIK